MSTHSETCAHIVAVDLTGSELLFIDISEMNQSEINIKLLPVHCATTALAKGTLSPSRQTIPADNGNGTMK